jgi:hypothetical protein
MRRAADVAPTEHGPSIPRRGRGGLQRRPIIPTPDAGDSRAAERRLFVSTEGCVGEPKRELCLVCRLISKVNCRVDIRGASLIADGLRNERKASSICGERSKAKAP